MISEAVSLKLLCDMHGGLSRALNSLRGKKSNGLLDYFLFYLAAHMNRAAEGYIVVRKASKIDASKLLIRPRHDPHLGGPKEARPALPDRLHRTERGQEMDSPPKKK
jgi:hypothetical protein